MDNCNMKRGFFFLRECDHPAREECRVCGKAFCNEHLRIHPQQNAPVCLDCLGKQIQGAKDKSCYKDQYQTWGYGYRHNYYQQDYTPFYVGHRNSNDDFFDNYDVRSFDTSSENDPDAEDFDAEANTFDS